MSARKLTATGVIGGLLGFVGMSAVAGLLVAAAVTPAVAMTGIAANNSIGVFEGLPEYLKIDPLATRSTMYATKDGQPVPIATFYSQNRVIDSWSQINQLAKDAAVSTEDPRFYEHGGIDVQGTIRAIVSNAFHPGAEVQGGSSITQQYVKNVRLQTCEKYNVLVQGTGTDEQDQAAQAALNKKYQSCYDQYTQQTPVRKIQEMKLAIGIEKKYNKQDILLGYLNIAGFGGQVYGIESAARYYFNTTAAQLNLEQAATLIAIVNNPNSLRIDRDMTTKDKSGKVVFENTAANGYAETLSRRDYVLRSMLKAKTITQAQYDTAAKTKIEPQITPQPSGCAQAAGQDAAFFCNAVMAEMRDNTAFGKTQDQRDALLSHGGLQIYTTLNLNLQEQAQSSLSAYIPPTSPKLNLGAADTAVELNTGRVVMAVQNRPYNTTNTLQPDSTQTNYAFDYNHGGSSGFQTGSTYKAFSLIEWLKEGHSLNDVVNAPTARQKIPERLYHASCAEPGPGAGTWDVGNDSPGEGGAMTVLTATKLSVNSAFAVMGQRLDLCGIRNDARDLGVKPAYPWQQVNDNGVIKDAVDANGKKVPSYLEDNVSSILGTNSIAPIDMAVAYAGIANMGKTCSPIYIDKVVGSDGKDVPVPQTTCTQVLDPATAAGVIYALHTPLQPGGTGAAANPNDGVPIMGKTGTTDAYGQNWLVTSTTKIANAVWVGNVQQTKVGNTWQNIDFRNLNFNGAAGNRVKFILVKPILQNLNAVYGGDDWAGPDQKTLYGEQVQVPDLSGKSTQEAQTVLQGLGFTYQAGGDQDSPQPQGTVAGSNPPAGSKVGKGSPVTVYTSRGNQVVVPDVTNKQLSDAIKQLTAAGLAPQFGGPVDPNGTVSAEDPGPGTPVGKGSAVKLSVDPGGDGNNGGGPGNGGNNGGGNDRGPGNGGNHG